MHASAVPSLDRPRTVSKVAERMPVHMKGFAQAGNTIDAFPNSHALMLIPPRLWLPLATAALNIC